MWRVSRRWRRPIAPSCAGGAALGRQDSAVTAEAAFAEAVSATPRARAVANRWRPASGWRWRARQTSRPPRSTPIAPY